VHPFRAWLRILCLLLLAWPLNARAEVTLIAPDGPLIPGKVNRLLVVLHREGKAVTEALPAVAATPGEVSLAQGRIRDGVYGYHYLPAADAQGSVVFTIGTGSGGITRIKKPLAPMPSPVLRGPQRVDVVAGSQQEVTLGFTGSVSSAEQVTVKASEGRVKAVTVREDGLDVVLELSAERFPRVVLVGVLDHRRPDSPPAWAVLRIVGRPTIPVRTEPGAEVILTVGKRNYGPFQAGDDGVALASISAWPGEETAAVRIRDQLGNVQHSTLNLVREPKPLLLDLPAPPRPPGEPAAPLYLGAADITGQHWSAAPPTCHMAPGGSQDVAQVATGTYKVLLSPPDDESYLDLRLACELPGTMTRLQTRISSGEGIPRKLLLRIYPAALSADFPVAQLQALLEDRQGERLAPDDIRLQANLGEVSLDESRGGALRGEYNGALAASAGGDEIRAFYDMPTGSGAVALLQVAHGPVETGPGGLKLRVYGRARDSQGRPLADLPLTMSAGEESATASTDARGWAWVDLALQDAPPLVVLEARSDFLVARQPLLPADPDPAVDLERPDLEALVEVPITAGRVREVFISTEPSTLYSGPSAMARVHVRLVDRHGNAVTDETIGLKADLGETGTLRAGPDGTYEAWYRPPQGMRAGKVHLAASGQEGAFAAATELEIIPRPLARAVSLCAGGLTNLGSIHSFYSDLNLELRLPLLKQRVLLRSSVSFYGDERVFTDETTEEEISIRTMMIPMMLAATLRRESGLRATWIGTGLVMLLYRSETHFGPRIGTSDMGLGGPGAALYGGLGWRLGFGELGLELRYILVTTEKGDLGYSGPVGGVAPTVGYRVLF